MWRLVLQVYTVVDNLPRPEEADMDAELTLDPLSGATLDPLGTGVAVPRFLRWEYEVPIKVLSKPATIATVRELFEAKVRAWDIDGSTESSRCVGRKAIS
jgi:hypothetical protein